MIRLKCPKCAEPLAVEDEDAGGIGECGECGAKFRIPAAKSKPAGGRKGDDDEKVAAGAPSRKRRAAAVDEDRPQRRPIRDDDDDDDDDEDDDDQPHRPKGKKATAAQRQQFWMNVRVVLTLLGFAILVGLACLFINKAGFILAVLCVVLGVVCGLGLTIMVWRDDPLWGLMMMIPGIGPVVSLIYLIHHWEKCWKLIAAAFAFYFLAGLAFGAGLINLGWREVYRDNRRHYIKIQGGAEVWRPLNVAWAPPPNRLPDA